MIIATVLRSGNEYAAEHVRWLHKQLPENVTSVCFSDCDISGINTIPLLNNWPGWWAKLELFRPDIREDIFYLDLDTVIIGDITRLLSEKRLTMLRDFYHQGQIGSAVMRIPHNIKSVVWNAFIENPDYHMNHCNLPDCWGDQGFLSQVLTPEIWQDNYPRSIVSYKKHIAFSGMPGCRKVRAESNGILPAEAKIVCFHGNPRPWDRKLKLSWIPEMA